MSARGRASERGVEKGSGAGQPKNVVELLLLKKLCRFPPPGSHVTHYTKTFDITRDDKGRASTHILSRQYRNSIYSISNSPKIWSVRSLNSVLTDEIHSIYSKYRGLLAEVGGFYLFNCRLLSIYFNMAPLRIYCILNQLNIYQQPIQTRIQIMVSDRKTTNFNHQPPLLYNSIRNRLSLT